MPACRSFRNSARREPRTLFRRSCSSAEPTRRTTRRRRNPFLDILRAHNEGRRRRSPAALSIMRSAPLEPHPADRHQKAALESSGASCARKARTGVQAFHAQTGTPSTTRS